MSILIPIAAGLIGFTAGWICCIMIMRITLHELTSKDVIELAQADRREIK